MKSRKDVFCAVTSRVLFLMTIACFLSTGVSFAGEKKEKVKWVRSKTGLGSLMTLSKDRGKMTAVYKKETKRYESVRKAVDSGVIKKGMSDKEVAKKYGEAILTISENGGERTRWVYKPSDSTYSKGLKVYLFFNSEGSLEKWETVG